jgi:hypothetical protein
MKRKQLCAVVASLLMSSFTVDVVAGTPPPLQTTAFSYQGQLNAGGIFPTAQYQFTFTLYTAAVGGSVVSVPIQQNIQVVNGLFTTDLDFGQVFNGTQYWLDIQVGTALDNEEELSARQPINVVPVAQYALNSPAGTAGPAGPQGPQGDAGVQGAQGPQGDQGVQGAQGSVGTQGPAGPQGNVGTQGPQGLAGTNGSQGPQGLQGPQGVAGSNGSQGPQGTAGTNGAQGAPGAAGPQGLQGPQGTQGAQGAAGSLSSVSTVVNPATPVAGAGAALTLTASCPVTKLRITGACLGTGPNSDNNGTILAGSYPSGASDWICQWSYADFLYTHQAIAICTP